MSYSEEILPELLRYNADDLWMFSGSLKAYVSVYEGKTSITKMLAALILKGQVYRLFLVLFKFFCV